MPEILRTTDTDGRTPELSGSTPAQFRASLLHHLRVTVGKAPTVASRSDWLLALSRTIRDRATEPWLDATRRASQVGPQTRALPVDGVPPRTSHRRRRHQSRACAPTPSRGARRPRGELREHRSTTNPTPPSATAGSAASPPATSNRCRRSHCPAFGYGLRYERGLFSQDFDARPTGRTPRRLARPRIPVEPREPKAVYEVRFGGYVDDERVDAVCEPHRRRSVRYPRHRLRRQLGEHAAALGGGAGC